MLMLGKKLSVNARAHLYTIGTLLAGFATFVVLGFGVYWLIHNYGIASIGVVVFGGMSLFMLWVVYCSIYNETKETLEWEEKQK